jgi:hypothetical protein
MKCKFKMKKKDININVLIYSLIALFFVVLAFVVNWIFIVFSIILIFFNQKELLK